MPGSGRIPNYGTFGIYGTSGNFFVSLYTASILHGVHQRRSACISAISGKGVAVAVIHPEGATPFLSISSVFQAHRIGL